MKKHTAVLLVLIVFILPKANSQAVITGSLKNVKDTINWVYAYYAVDGKRIADSIEVKNDKYAFNLNITEPTQVTLRARKFEVKTGVAALSNRTTKKDIATLFIEKGKITVVSVDSFSNTTVKGSKTNDEFVKLTALAKPYNDQMQELNKQFSALLKEQKKEEAISQDEICGRFFGIKS